MAGRPSNRDERTEQVMAALVKTVSRLGVDGASLNAIAKEAGMTRPLVRHHLGNREDMLVALEDYVLERFNNDTELMLAALPEENAGHSLIELLFSEAAGASSDLVMAFAALTARAADDEELRGSCRKSIEGFEEAIAGVLSAQFPRATEHDVRTTAQGIAALYFNAVSLAPLKMPHTWRLRATTLAHSLVKALGEPS